MMLPNHVLNHMVIGTEQLYLQNESMTFVLTKLLCNKTLQIFSQYIVTISICKLVFCI